jgi:hypothetical protein
MSAPLMSACGLHTAFTRTELQGEFFDLGDRGIVASVNWNVAFKKGGEIRN